MPKSNPLKLVIDTNLWISIIISRELRLLDNLLFDGNLRLLFSEELMQEKESTIAKPRLKKYFGENTLEEMLTVLHPYIDLIKVKSTVQVCRDPKDDFLLALAKDGRANYVLTGDKDLLVFGRYGRTQILTIADFISKTKSY